MLEYINPSKLVAHEDIELENLNKIISCIRKYKAIKPVIVDENTLVILDGHHRTKAAINLGIKKIPVYLVNYFDNRIKVNSFALNIDNINLAKYFIKDSPDGKFCINLISRNVCADSLYSLYWKINSIQSYLKYIGFNIRKTQNDGIILPRLEKDYVIDIARKGLRFPPRTTRHTYEFIIPQNRILVNEFL
ncbi:chromosome partitioning protein ParB [Acidianus sulfidivorans JP7]|uniref:Chromosome partitioning protein ParB n=1 Tax=Acidianus sulfidivorans JP7 TaxID=619593 RepID=A0A2U9ILZ5_9CREN|nr:ParB N-terminal domain-containing protein [Acidianus sulfidivorans]AWR97089.1 chromosome partitioning protein ParB [Acidianus sulfidivorans JP7]